MAVLTVLSILFSPPVYMCISLQVPVHCGVEVSASSRNGPGNGSVGSTDGDNVDRYDKVEFLVNLLPI